MARWYILEWPPSIDLSFLSLCTSCMGAWSLVGLHILVYILVALCTSSPGERTELAPQAQGYSCTDQTILVQSSTHLRQTAEEEGKSPLPIASLASRLQPYYIPTGHGFKRCLVLSGLWSMEWCSFDLLSRMPVPLAIHSLGVRSDGDKAYEACEKTFQVQPKERRSTASEIDFLQDRSIEAVPSKGSTSGPTCGQNRSIGWRRLLLGE